MLDVLCDCLVTSWAVGAAFRIEHSVVLTSPLDIGANETRKMPDEHEEQAAGSKPQK